MDLTQCPETVQKTIAISGVQIEGIFYLICGILLLGATIISIPKVWKSIEDEALKAFMVLFSIPFGLSILCLWRGILETFAPAYWILKQILNI